ncbi:hypothetical protein KAU25_06330 [Candidatus Bathyarchaeota archaeon]|nr:hypothetical protein [Candidatus Bathyarchaeota archaeon]
MSSSSPLEQWKFLIGRWKGTAKNEFGEEGVIESTHVFSAELGDKFITGRHEAWNKGKLVHKAASFLYYDPRKGKFRRKDIYSYGFVNNEVEYIRTDSEIRFEVSQEPSPKQFDGIRWRAYIRKISENKIAMGLEWAKAEGAFKSFGETTAIKEP